MLEQDPFDPEMAVLPRVPQCKECKYFLKGGLHREDKCRHIELNAERTHFLKGESFTYAHIARSFCENPETKIPSFFKPAPPKLNWRARFLLWLAQKCGAR